MNIRALVLLLAALGLTAGIAAPADAAGFVKRGASGHAYHWQVGGC